MDAIVTTDATEGLLFHLILYRPMGILLQFSSDFLILFLFELDGRNLLLQALEDDKKRRNDKDLAERTDEHTTYGGST
jgi:hypothetical protein